MEHRLCTDNHKDSHLLLTRGMQASCPVAGTVAEENVASGGRATGFSARELREIMDFRKECKKQKEKNIYAYSKRKRNNKERERNVY